MDDNAGEPSRTDKTDAPQIMAEVACSRCDYLLRGLKSDGNCPECGQLIEVSLTGGYLAQADPRWLTRLFIGATCCFLGVVIACATIAVLFAFYFSRPTPEWVLRLLSTSEMQSFAEVFHFIGVWLLTSSLTRGLGPLQRSLRIVAIVHIALQIVTPGQFIGPYAILISGLVGTIMRVLVLLQIRHLGTLESNHVIAHHSVVLIWCFGVHLLLNVAMFWTGRMNSEAYSVLWTLITIGCFVYYSVVLNQLRVMLTRASKISASLRVG